MIPNLNRDIFSCLMEEPWTGKSVEQSTIAMSSIESERIAAEASMEDL
ncbi:hypothetical protein Tco_1305368, partial [Tanacetum coccineum]